MKIKWIYHTIIFLITAPFIVFPIVYSMRWVVTGAWVQGGGERAGVGLLIAMFISLFHLIIYAIDDCTK